MSREELSLRQRLHNADGAQKVENLRARHAYLHGRNYSTEEWGNLWSRSKNASWAHTFGRVRGFDAVWYVGVSSYDAKAARNYLQVIDHMPEVGGIDMRPLMMVAFHTLSTDVIEVAEDGKSARAFDMTAGVSFNNIGQKRPGMAPSSGMGNERYGADFVCENGTWLFLHEHICMDVQTSWSGGDWARQSYNMEKNPGMGFPGMPGGMPPAGGGAPGGADSAPGGMPGGPGGPGPEGGGNNLGSNLGLGTPEMMEPEPLHFDYSALQTTQNTVPPPRPYKTLDNDNTYTAPIIEE